MTIEGAKQTETLNSGAVPCVQEVDRLEQKLAKEKALRRRAEERLQAREEEESRMEAERDSSRPPLEK